MTEQAEVIQEILKRGVNEVIDEIHLQNRLKRGERLRIKLGIDPTSPNIHLGHATLLLKLRDFQNAGHQIVLVIGDFTGEIGDTSDKDSERPMLSSSEVRSNMRTYLDQVSQLINVRKTKIVYNSSWLSKLNYHDIAEQANIFSLHEFIGRSTIKKRLKAGRRISLRELMYPLMQGYDSVMVGADIEIGGSDQKFNMLAGRTLQQFYNQPAQDILMTDLIPGTDGTKMSKSKGNTINLSDAPDDIFGKVMRIPDAFIVEYFIHTTRVPLERVNEIKKDLKKRGTNPRNAKSELAFEIVKIIKGEREAISARDHFIRLFQEHKMPEEIPSVEINDLNLVSALVGGKLASSNSEARRLIRAKGIRVNGTIIENENHILKEGDILQRGKRQFIKVKSL